MSDRITTLYTAGSGDFGYSELMYQSGKLRKDDVACELYSSVEHLNNTISDLFDRYVILDTELGIVLKYIQHNSFSLSSFFFNKGDTEKHALPDNLLEFLEQSITDYKELAGNAKDFIIQDTKQLILLDKIRIQIRDVERHYVSWFYHNTIREYLFKVLLTDKDKAQNIAMKMILVGKILNRLSTYIFSATRNEAMLMKNAGLIEDVPELYWQGKVEQFPLC